MNFTNRVLRAIPYPRRYELLYPTCKMRKFFAKEKMRKFFALIALLLTACSSPSNSADTTIHYRAGDPYIESVAAEAESYLPFNVKLVPSTTKEDIRIRRAPTLTEGCAHICSSSGWVNVVEFNHKGSRRDLAVHAIIHEVGHMIGASHRESDRAYMNTGILYNLDKTLNWEMKSLEEIEECIG